MLKNFPAQRVSEVGDHACVDLKETVLLHASHGAKFNFCIDEHTGERSNEGLNDTQAMTALMKNVNTSMKIARLRKN